MSCFHEIFQSGIKILVFSRFITVVLSFWNFCITVFWKISVKTTSLVKWITVKLISRNISQVIQNFRKLHTALWFRNTEILLHIFDINCLNATVLSKKLISRNIFSVRDNFTFFQCVRVSKWITDLTVWKNEKFTATQIFSAKSIYNKVL